MQIPGPHPLKPHWLRTWELKITGFTEKKYVQDCVNFHEWWFTDQLGNNDLSQLLQKGISLNDLFAVNHFDLRETQNY